MAVVIITGSQANAAGGGDIIPAAVDWTNVSVTNTSGIETTNEVTFTGIDSPITVRAAWTSTSSSPTKAQWLYNSAAVQSPALSSVEATIIVNGKLKWQTYCAYTHPSGNSDSGTVRVTNESRNATCTMTIATPAVVSKVGHGYSASDKILFRTTGALPTGVTAEQVYFVSATHPTPYTLTFAATDGGALIDPGGTQGGVHPLFSGLDTFPFACRSVRPFPGGDGPEVSEPEPPAFPHPP